MFEVYKSLALHFNADLGDEQLDLVFFEKLKNIIIKLLYIQPEKRMKLKDARKQLNELSEFQHHFLLLKSFEPSKNDLTMTYVDETTQNSLRLMDEIRNTRLFTIQTTGDDMKLTQRSTNLCVSFTAMRMLSYALWEFLDQHSESTKVQWKDLKMRILAYPEISNSRTTQERHIQETHSSLDKPTLRTIKKTILESKSFINNLILICCAVISPRSLNGLNHCHLDDNFQMAAQQQNIRE